MRRRDKGLDIVLRQRRRFSAIEIYSIISAVCLTVGRAKKDETDGIDKNIVGGVCRGRGVCR